MTEDLYVAGEFYGIQKYVLGITAAGGGQAKRLRARSFTVQAMEDVVLFDIGALGSYERVVSGGGQFVLRIKTAPDLEQRLLDLRVDLQRRLLADLGGELGFNLGWADSVEGALRARSRERRRPWAGVMSGPAGWDVQAMSFDDIAPPCEVCRRKEATKTWTSDGPPENVCARCYADRHIGEIIPRAQGVELTDNGAEAHLLGRGIRLVRRDEAAQAASAPTRSTYRHVPAKQDGGRLVTLTFEDIANQSQGDQLLGILKADVDNFGRLIAEHMQPGKLDKLRTISDDLDAFFSVAVQRLIGDNMRWQSIYTVFSGGDDLLLVGPWNVILDFAAEVQSQFSEGPGKRYGINLSAAVSFMPPRIPIRHGVKRAEEELKKAKAGEKNRCATLQGVWKWEDLRRILDDARRLVEWYNCGAAKKSPLRKLYRIVTSTPPAAHLWAWELGRNFPSRNEKQPEHRLFREWGDRVLSEWGPQLIDETGAALLYALTATRTRSKDERRDHEAEDGRGRRGR